MREVDRIEKQLRCAIEGGAWHGPSLLELLSDVSHEKARSQSLPDAHSIWELTLHITTWIRAGIQGMAGEKMDYPPEVDWPVVTDEGEEAWRSAVQELKEAHENLCAAVLRMGDRRLDEIVAGSQYTVYVLLHGVAQHNLYHAGQIALLKKY